MKVNRFQVKTVVVKKIRRGRLPLRPREEIDLDMVSDELRNVFEIKYDPESGFNAPSIHIKIGRANYEIFKKGTVMIAGNLTIKKELKILAFLWKQHIKHCVF